MHAFSTSGGPACLTACADKLAHLIAVFPMRLGAALSSAILEPGYLRTCRPARWRCESRRWLWALTTNVVLSVVGDGAHADLPLRIAFPKPTTCKQLSAKPQIRRLLAE